MIAFFELAARRHCYIHYSIMKNSVSVVIPSYNGSHLLKENLSNVIVQLTPGDELVIVDDASQDNTVAMLVDRFKLNLQAEGADEFGQFMLYATAPKAGVKVKLIVNTQNLRFAASCNRGVQEANNPLIFLLNTDVKLKHGVIKNLVKEFADIQVFAVGCFEEEPNKNEVGGKNKLWFEKGLYHHSRADDFNSGPTAWVSGGSGMFDREKWLQLGGFDRAYYPAYWEDIDLSQRARQKGWKVFFSRSAKVVHDHESTNKSVFNQDQLNKYSWQHADYFTWKHATPIQRMQFLLYRPYWWLQRAKLSFSKKYSLALLLILLLATILRFYRLAQVPAGMTWDEAAIGYNGYAVIQTRFDEWLQRLPISFKSFGDFKAPLAIYLTGFFVSLFGMNLWAVRLPFAISGVLAVWGMIKLTAKILPIHQPLSKKRTTLSSESLGLLAGLLLAISPWHLHFTRVGFESGLALTLIIWGTYALASYFLISSKTSLFKRLSFLLGGLTLLVASMYTYHSPKIFVPVFLISLVAIHWKVLMSKWREFVIGTSFFGLLLLPMIIDSFFGEGLTRGGSLIFSQSRSIIELAQLFLHRLLVHLSPAFLTGGWTDSLRHGTEQHSVFLATVFVVMIVGLVGLTTQSIKKQGGHSWLKISILWIFLGLLPAALGDQYPQANRALLALPGFIWLAISGWQILVDWLRLGVGKIKLPAIVCNLLLIAALLVNCTFYLHHYYQYFASASANDFNEGYLEAMELVVKYEKGIDGMPPVDKIVFSNQYGQPYIYALFAHRTNPIWYQGGSLNKFQFLDKVDINHLSTKNTLVVATKHDDVVGQEPVHQVVTNSGEIRFKFYYSGE